MLSAVRGCNIKTHHGHYPQERLQVSLEGRHVERLTVGVMRLTLVELHSEFHAVG